MKRKRRHEYTIGSISSGTMHAEDLIPAFLSQLEHELKHGPKQDRATRKAHAALVRAITKRSDLDSAEESEEYFDSDHASDDIAALEDALEAYAAPYFYFGSHPRDGADYGFWLSESWDEDFIEVDSDGDARIRATHRAVVFDKEHADGPILVSGTEDIPAWYRGEVAVVNDHGNVTLYNKTARKLTEIWGVV